MENSFYYVISQDLLRATASLKDSQLVHTPTFQYRHAMCAAELMDPKMDMGMRVVPDRNIVQKMLDTGELSTEFAAPDVHAIFDKLLQLEVRGPPSSTVVSFCESWMYHHDCIV